MASKKLGLLALTAAFCAIGASRQADARDVVVDDAGGLKAAIERAEPGDVILLRPGEYALGGIAVTRAGTSDRPVILRAAKLGEARLKAHGVELFKLHAGHWVFENLDIAGVCRNDDDCEHAFHIVGKASGTVIRNNRLRDFNSAIKGNGEGGAFPSDVVIEGNTIANAAPRRTAAPTTPIDVVGGRRWTVRSNVIADFGKLLGDRTSYGAFFKGNSFDGVFDRNLIVCEWRHKGGLRVGLSLGGGGTTDPRFCEDGDCRVQHTNGRITNNVIMNCPNEIGIYLNRARGTRIYNNTLYRNFGIVVRYPESTAEIANNLVSGSIITRDGGEVVDASENVLTGTSIAPWVPGGLRHLKEKLLRAAEKYPNYLSFDPATYDAWGEVLARSWIGRGDARFDDWFRSPSAGDFSPRKGADIPFRLGAAVEEMTHDFCGGRRGVLPYLGAIEPRAGTCDVASILRERLGPPMDAVEAAAR